MPKILLIDANTTPFNEAIPVYPVGLDYVQGALKAAGFADTYLLDLRSAGGNLPDYEQRRDVSLEILRRKLAEADWSIIGIGIRNIDSTYPPDPDQIDWHYYLPRIKEARSLSALFLNSQGAETSLKLSLKVPGARPVST